MTDKPIAVLYEHHQWFQPLFAELKRRQVAHENLSTRDHTYDPAERVSAFALIVSRVSAYPSSGSHPQIVLYDKQYLAHLDAYWRGDGRGCQLPGL